MEMSAGRKWLLIFGFCTFFGLLSASTQYTEQLLEEHPEPFSLFLVYELTATYAFFLLLPLLFWFARRFPFQRSTWYAVLPLHILFSMGIGAAHTSLMTLGRTPLFPLLFGKPYQMGDPFYRYLMEYQKQVLVYAAVMLTIHLFRAHREKRAREKRAIELELEAAQLRSRLAEAQLNVLRGEVQPHFLFNTLNMISSLMYEDVARADRMIGQLSSLLRVTLDHGQKPKVQLGREIDFARSYLEIMSGRFEDRLRFRFNVPSRLTGALVPGFLIQPLVENAVKHGMRDNQGILEVSIEVSADQGNLSVEVLDNGPGLDGPPSQAMGHGLGLSNTRDRLERLYGGRFRFEIDNRQEGGCAVRIEIPLEFDDSAAGTREVA
jgi:signal transduction histidine kinase